MSKLLEIFGKGITVNNADLIWHWLRAVSASGDSQTDTPVQEVQDSEFNRIIDQLGNLELDKAQESLNFYLFENPSCVRGRMAAAALCLHRHDLDGAMEQARSVYMRQPSNTLALFTLGYCLERMDKQEEALEFYQDCVKFKSYLQLPRQRMAAIYLKDSRTEKTINQYQQLVADHPDDISSMVLLGYLYLYDHQYEQAATAFNSAIISHPDNFHDDKKDQLETVSCEEQFEQQVENVQWLIEQVGEMPDLCVRMGDILGRAGRLSDAIIQYETAVHIQPNYLEATIKLGTAYLQMRRYMLAAEQFNTAVEINDEIVDSYIGLAISQHLSGDSDQAYRTLSLTGAIQQNSTLLFSETATLHFQAILNEHEGLEPETSDRVILIDDVVRAHQEQMKKSPAGADTLYKYGVLMMITGNIDAAIESFNHVLEINPTHYRARGKMALCLHEKGKFDKAINLLASGDSLQLTDVELHYKTALLFSDRRKFAVALHNLENRLKDNFTHTEAVTNVRVVLENLGLVDRASSTWDRLSETAHAAMNWLVKKE